MSTSTSRQVAREDKARRGRAKAREGGHGQGVMARQGTWAAWLRSCLPAPALQSSVARRTWPTRPPACLVDLFRRLAVL